MTARLCLCLCLYLYLQFACALPAMAQRPGLAVGVVRQKTDSGNVYQVDARGEVAAAPEAVWRILTDYESMPDFVPDLQSARVLSRSGDDVVLEQNGTAHLLFFRRTIHLVVQVHEQPPSRIDISLVEGDMRIYQCSWRLVPLPETGGTRVLYSGKLAPNFYVPGMFGANMLRADIRRMMAAVLARLDQEGVRP
jgi:ribosome-associated toxin RatA of RatAB toxin-antitoxin module